MIKFALCDDNSLLLSKLKEMLEIIFFKNNLDANVVFSTNTASKLINFISQNEVDVLFLDIDLN